MTCLWHCAHMTAGHCLHNIQQYLGKLSEVKKWQVMTLRTWGWSQTQLAAEFHITQSNVSKLLKKIESLSKCYINNILEPFGIPFGLDSIGRGFIFQDDNAYPHTDLKVQWGNIHQMKIQ